MKYVILLIGFLLSACNVDPTIDGENPFVVVEISLISDNMCRYESKIDSKGRYGTLICPCEYYKVGDTITFKK